MSQELIYTSAPRGLKPGSQGFCTVAHTAQMPSALVDRIESLSGYTPVFPPSSPRTSENPVSYCHWKLDVLGQNEIVVSRVASAGLDYTDRTNKLAHHIVLSRSERPVGGPAWLVRQRGLLRSTWDGDVGTIADGPAIPKGDREPAICEAWNRVTGDAGWAGALVESFLTNPDRLVYVIYPHGVDVLELFEEAISLAPVPRRWEITFCTYLTTVPQGVRCQWRGVLQGTAPEQQARNNPHALRIDLTNGKLAAAPDSAYADFARTGIPPQTQLAETSDPADWQEENLAPSPTTAANRQAPANLQAFALAPGDLAPSSSRQVIPPIFTPHMPATTEQGRRRRVLWPFLLGSIVVALISFGIGVTLSRMGLLAIFKSQPEIADEKQIAANPTVRVETETAQENLAPSKPNPNKPDDVTPSPTRRRAKSTSPPPNETTPLVAKPIEEPPPPHQESSKSKTPAREPEPTPSPTEKAKPVEKKEPQEEKKEKDHSKASMPTAATTSKEKIVPKPPTKANVTHVSIPIREKASVIGPSDVDSGIKLMTVSLPFMTDQLSIASGDGRVSLQRTDSKSLVYISKGLVKSTPVAGSGDGGTPFGEIRLKGRELELIVTGSISKSDRNALEATLIRVRMKDQTMFIAFKLPVIAIPLGESSEALLPAFGRPALGDFVFDNFVIMRRGDTTKLSGKTTSLPSFEYTDKNYKLVIDIKSSNDGDFRIVSKVDGAVDARKLREKIAALEKGKQAIEKLLKDKRVNVKATEQIINELAALTKKKTLPDPARDRQRPNDEALRQLLDAKSRELDESKAEMARLIDYHNYFVNGVVFQNIDGQLFPILGIGPNASDQ